MSIVNHAHCHTFIHVPKTAGSAMEQMYFVGGVDHDPMSQLGRSTPADYFTWAFVRNPYDRAVSTWAAINSPASTKQIRDNFGGCGFEELLLRLHENRETWQNSLPHFRPQHWFTHDEHGQRLLDFIGYFENIDVDWNRVCLKVIGKYIPLSKVNATDHRPWREMHTHATIQICNWIYAHDFTLFDYPRIE